MKINLKIVRFVAAATLGSLLWAGCASPRDGYASRTLDNRPVDLTDFHADTFPEHRTALFGSQYSQYSVVDVYNPVITEAAGAERDADVYNEPIVDLETEPKPDVRIEADRDVDIEIKRRP